MKNRTLKSLSSLSNELERADSIQKRLELLVDQVGNPNAFAKLTGLSVSGLKRYLGGGEPTASKIIQISDAIGINPGWLLTGKGSIYDEEEKPDQNVRALALLGNDGNVLEELDSKANEVVEKYKYFKNKLSYSMGHLSDAHEDVLITSFVKSGFSKETIESLILNLDRNTDDICAEFAFIPGYRIQVSAGQGALNGDQIKPIRYLAFRKKWLSFRGFNEKDLVIVWAKGDSMEPAINNNDTLVVHTGRTRPQDGHMYIFRNGDELFVKRYQSALGTWRLISDNPVYPPLDIKKEDQHQFEVVGQIIHVAKDCGE